MSTTFLLGAIDVPLSSDRTEHADVSLRGGGRRISPWHLGHSHFMSHFLDLGCFIEEEFPSMPPFFASIAAMATLPVCSTADEDVDEPQENIDVDGRDREFTSLPLSLSLSLSLSL